MHTGYRIAVTVHAANIGLDESMRTVLDDVLDYFSLIAKRQYADLIIGRLVTDQWSVSEQ